MRDAFGGAFSIKLMLIFLILYVSFICVALNYARAFRVKNRIINIIEQYEGYNKDNSTYVDEMINEYLNNAGYSIKYDDTRKANGESVSGCEADFNGFIGKGRGYCINQIIDTSTKSTYYQVETYMKFTLPIVNVNFPIAIRGETRKIEKLSR